ncbi:HU family DNA-binding protein [Marivivens marinus]|uniref:HU family DNA-binding protein n=1 Tax=Marivivens marinus TaxID=3110173 RepID=UPI003B848E72
MARKTKPVVLDVKAPEAETTPEVVQTIGRKEFIARVSSDSGLKPKDARVAVDAVLSALAAALRDGQEMNLPPLGKIKHVKSKDIGGAKVATVRVRIPEQGVKKAGSDPLAEMGEEG